MVKVRQQRPLSMRFRIAVTSENDCAFGKRCLFCGIPIVLYNYATWEHGRPESYAHWQCWALHEEPVESMPSVKEGDADAYRYFG